MFDAKRLLDQFMGGQGGQGGQGGSSGGGDFLRGAGGGALAGGLAAILLGTKTGRKLGGEALKLGGCRMCRSESSCREGWTARRSWRR